jgi:hypothetical protein
MFTNVDVTNGYFTTGATWDYSETERNGACPEVS